MTMSYNKYPHCKKPLIGACRALVGIEMCGKPAVDFVEIQDYGERTRFPVCQKHYERFNNPSSKRMYFKRHPEVSDYTDGYAGR